jgi:hypothetical protein
VEPLAALVALSAVCAGVALYADALAASVPESDRDLAPPVLSSVHDRVAEEGVVSPSRFENASTTPAVRTNLTLRAAGRTWTVGPAPPPGRTDAASRSASVRLGPGRVAAGRLRAEVWE